MSWKSFVSLQASSGEHNNLGHIHDHMETNRIIVLLFYCSFLEIWKYGKKFFFKGELLKLFEVKKEKSNEGER